MGMLSKAWNLVADLLSVVATYAVAAWARLCACLASPFFLGQNIYCNWLQDQQFLASSRVALVPSPRAPPYYYTLGSLSLLLLLSPSVSATQVPNPVNWQHVEQTLIAEAASEGYDGMLAVAEVMRARNWNLRPFCASRRKDLATFVAKQPASVQANAKKAVAAARAGSATVHHATHYENIEAFGLPSWAKGQTPVAKVGRHTFFRLAR